MIKHIFVMGAYFNTDQQDIDAYSYIADVFKNKIKNVKITQPIDIENYRQNYILQNPTADINNINKEKSAIIELLGKKKKTKLKR